MKDPISQSEKCHHVKQELASWSGKKGKSTEVYTFISCPWHAENTPSGQVFHGSGTRSPGIFKCLGCGTKATWDKVAEATGMKPFGKNAATDQYSRPLSIGDPDDDPVAFELEDLPLNKMWRSMSTNFLTKVGCKMMVTQYGSMVYLPIIINGEERGFVKARLKKDPTGERPSYINRKGPWSKSHGLFPFDYAIKIMRRLKSRTIVLVEGPRDALRLLSEGIPAMSILGTNTWSQRKATLLELHGVKRVILMMDGDEAGILATDKIEPDIQNILKLCVYRLWEVEGNPYFKYLKIKDKDDQKAFKSQLWDPGNCPERVLLDLKTKYFS